MNLVKLWEMVRDREASYAAVHGVTKSFYQKILKNPILNYKLHWGGRSNMLTYWEESLFVPIGKDPDAGND